MLNNKLIGFVRGRIKSFTYALSGIRQVFQSETNFRIHSLAVLLTSAAGLWMQISTSEWLAILICFATVLATEALNTSIEKLGDILAPEHYSKIGPVKDIAAGAVLITALTAVLVALIVFVPKIVVLCGFEF